jgi:hypothetical protein
VTAQYCGKQPQGIRPATIRNVSTLDLFCQYIGLHGDDHPSPGQCLACKQDLQIVRKFVPIKAHDIASWLAWWDAQYAGESLTAG